MSDKHVSAPEDAARAVPQTRIDLVPVTSLETDAQLAIRDIRNQPSIRSAMFTSHLIGVNEHLQWLNKLKQNDQQLVFAVLDSHHKPFGVASLKEIDEAHNKADWGFYISEEMRGTGVGAVVAFHFLDFSFEVLQLEKLNAEVIEGNEASLRYHAKFLFANEGFRNSNVVRDGNRVGVHLLGLQRSVWREQRALIASRCGGALERITATIHWEHDRDPPSPIDQIEAARARNNLNWMSILRIALERSPEQSKPIVAEIRKLDQEISALTQRLVE